MIQQKPAEFKPGLADLVRELLRNRSTQETLKSVADATGIPESWLGKFSSPSSKLKRIPVDYVENLYFHFTNSSLVPVTDATTNTRPQHTH